MAWIEAGSIRFCLKAASRIIKMSSSDSLITTNSDFRKLQIKFFVPFFLASFADWIQGPYVYKVYRDYGFNEIEIANLYIAGFFSSMSFGTCVGSLADKLGRKHICMLYGLTYSVCCLTKIHSNFYVLLCGRLFGGISTSILHSIFESWYVNEHINFYKFPVEWLNITFSSVTFGNGLVAIISGFIAFIFADVLQLGATSPFIVAVPFLIASSLMIYFCWDEHFQPKKDDSNFLPKTIFISFKFLIRDPCLITLGLVQAIFEGIMYTFIFSWTPVLEPLSPPLGIVFSCFMVALMIGSKIYSFLISKKFSPESILTISLHVSTFFISLVALFTCPLFNNYRILATYLCFLAFLIYETSVGIYFPPTAYLRGRIIPEEIRATVTNWLRVPTNIITCFTLFFIDNDDVKGSKLKSIHYVFVVCTVYLFSSLLLFHAFKSYYWAKRSNRDTQINIQQGHVELIL